MDVFVQRPGHSLISAVMSAEEDGINISYQLSKSRS